MLIACLKCTACGAEYPADQLMNLCPRDGRPVEIILDLERLAAEQPDLGWYRPERRDMWRFGGLLPLDVGSAAVLLAAIGASIVGGIIFLRHLVNFLSWWW